MYPLSKLRRIALEQQGLLRAAPYGRGRAGTVKTIRQLGYVQIDTISVVERAHNHVLATRVPNFQPRHLDELQRRGEIFEYWYHAAAYLPMEHYRFALRRMQAIRNGEHHWFRNHDHKLMAKVLRRIKTEGPLRARDFEGNGNSQGWWDWKPAKLALERLFLLGDLMISAREGFQKKYDLTERVLPSNIITTPPSTEEFARHLIDNTLRSHGFATSKSITYNRKGNPLRTAVKRLLDEAQASTTLTSFELPNGEKVFAKPELLEQRAPSAPKNVKILSPFDNAVIQRDRTMAVFDFDYQIECYVPEAKRRFGYFSLPILYQDRLVGRMDCKAHRTEKRFEVKHLSLEDSFTASGRDEQFRIAFSDSLQNFAMFNQCPDVTIKNVSPVSWKRFLS